MFPSNFFVARCFRVLLCLLLVTLAGFPAQAEAPANFEVGSFTFTRPMDWEWIPVTSTMRKAQLKVGKEPGADITFFHFGTQGGDVESNVKRWLAQFKSRPGMEKTDAQELSGTKVTMVTTEGTFSSGMPGGAMTPMENFALLGAILEGSDGNVYVKMVGPEALVKSNREKFNGFVAAAAKTKQ